MPTIKLSNAIIDRLKVSERTDFVDAATPGLILRVTPKGTATFSVRYKDRAGTYRRFKLGVYPKMGYEGACDEALKAKALLLDGRDPQGERVSRRTATTIDEAAELFFPDLRRIGRSASTIDTYKGRYRKHIKPAFGHRAAKSLTRAEIRTWLRGYLESPATTENLQTTLGALLTFCADEGFISVSPMWRMSRLGKAQKRKRIISPEEMREMWERLPDNLAGKALRVHLLTGQRTSEVCGMRISGLDGPWWYLTPEETKPKREHLVYLCPVALKIVRELVSARDAGYVFQSACKADRPISRANHSETFRKLAFDDARPHDFRRTFISWLYGQEVAEHVIGALVNHSSSDRDEGQRRAAPISRTVYNQFGYLPQRERWLEAWGEYVMRCVRGESAEVLTFERRG